MEKREESEVSKTEIPAEFVASFFLNQAPSIRTEDIQKVRECPYWERRKMSPEDLSKVSFWHFDPNKPDHVGVILTKNGKFQKLGDVAQAYLENLPGLRKDYPDFVLKIEEMQKALRAGMVLTPLLVIKGRRPGSASLVDGNHRALAILIEGLVDPEKNWQIDAFIGRKRYPFEDLFKKGRTRPLSSVRPVRSGAERP